MKALRLVKALFGDSVKRTRSKAITLEEEELPGGSWARIGDLSLRVGVIDNRPSAMSLRAHQSGQFTTSREFSQASTRNRVRVRVISYVSSGDARAMVPELAESFRRVERRHKKTIGISDVELPLETVRPIVRSGENSVFFEQSKLGPRGRVITKYMIGTAGNVVFLVGCTKPHGVFSWEEVIEVASLQVQKIQQSLRKVDEL